MPDAEGLAARVDSFDSGFDASWAEAEGGTATEAPSEVTEGTPAVTDGGSDARVEVDDFDFDTHADRTVVVKIDGVEERVPLSELRSGYMKGKSYTQKSQELSARQNDLDSWDALSAAFDENPQKALLRIAKDLGIPLTVAEAEAVVAAELSPVEQSVKEMQDELALVRRDREAAQLERELGRLESHYGDDFVSTDVMKYAIANKIGNLEHAFQVMMMPVLQAKLAEKAVAEKSATEEARIVEEKRAANVVSGGHTTRPGTAPPKIDSFEAAWLASGGTFD